MEKKRECFQKSVPEIWRKMCLGRGVDELPAHLSNLKFCKRPGSSMGCFEAI